MNNPENEQSIVRDLVDYYVWESRNDEFASAVDTANAAFSWKGAKRVDGVRDFTADFASSVNVVACDVLEDTAKILDGIFSPTHLHSRN